jgi:hypothetical protein
MPIPVLCACSAKIRAGDHLSGQHIKCPRCGAILPVGPTANGTGHAAPSHAATAHALLPAEQVLNESGLSDEEREQLEDELRKDERLLWAGKPVARVAFAFGWAFSAGFFFTALILLIMALVLALSDLGLSVMVWGVLGLLALGCTTVGLVVPFLNRARAAKVVYAATTKRALIWGCDWFLRVKLGSYDPTELAGLQRSRTVFGGEGVGNLVFGVSVQRKKTREGIVETRRSYGFFAIPEAEKVERLLREYLVDPFLDKLYE